MGHLFCKMGITLTAAGVFKGPRQQQVLAGQGTKHDQAQETLTRPVNHAAPQPYTRQHTRCTCKGQGGRVMSVSEAPPTNPKARTWGSCGPRLRGCLAEPQRGDPGMAPCLLGAPGGAPRATRAGPH